MMGRTFGRLTCVRAAGFIGPHAAWWFVCSCGNAKRIRGYTVRSGVTKSCGCLRSERARKHMSEVARKQVGELNPAYSHGHKLNGKESSELRSYRAAKERCERVKHVAYARYGGRGIEFRFSSFNEFFAELGPKPGARYTVDRINNDGHYEAGNVRWATYAEQNRNKR